MKTLYALASTTFLSSTSLRWSMKPATSLHLLCSAKCTRLRETRGRWVGGAEAFYDVDLTQLRWSHLTLAL